MAEQRQRKGRPEQVGALLPDAARALGFEEALHLSRRAALFDDVIAAIAPHLSGRCRLVALDRTQAIVEAGDGAAAQELHLRSVEISAAFSGAGAGEGGRVLGVTVRLAAAGPHAD
jgi:hypothetical protein